MKKTYITPATRIKHIVENSSMLAASVGAKTGLFENEDGTYTDSNVTEGTSVTGSSVLSKKLMIWNDNEEQ